MPTQPRTTKVVHGDDLLYRFFQNALAEDPHLPRLLVTSMGIWLPLEAYARWPVMLPWVVRDPKCRRDPTAGGADRWSSPDADGYLRDDNSLIKSLPRALTVRGPRGSHISGARIGTEFVACHVWRVVKDERLASRIPLLNSFVPNLVWIPRQVAKLSDLEGSIVQRTLQALAHQIYRQAPVDPHLVHMAEEAWALIPDPRLDADPVALDDLNWFEATERFFRTRSQRLNSVVDALAALERGEPIVSKVITNRYTDELPNVDPAARTRLKAALCQITGDSGDDETALVEYMSTANLVEASLRAERGDRDARAWLVARSDWLRHRNLEAPRVVVVNGEIVEIEVDGIRTYASRTGEPPTIRP